MLQEYYKTPENCSIIRRINGHTNNMGKSAGQEMNYCYEVEENGENFIYMYCNPDHFTKIDSEQFEKV